MKFDIQRFFDLFSLFLIESAKIKISEIIRRNLVELLNMIEEDEEWDEQYEQLSYFLATIAHETGFAFYPIKEKRAKPGTNVYHLQEKYWHTNMWGRGYVQITHLSNYSKFGELLKIDLVANPDLALNKDISYKIASLGMREGLFTGKKLSDYINENKTDFLNARKIINGLDRAADIEKIAKAFLQIVNISAIKEDEQEHIKITEWHYNEPATTIVTTGKPETITTVTKVEVPKPIVDDKNTEPIIIEKHLPEKLRSAYKYILATLTALGVSMATLIEWLNSVIQNKIFIRGMLIICAITIGLGILTSIYVMIRNLLERHYAHELTMKEMELTASPDKYNVKVHQKGAA